MTRGPKRKTLREIVDSKKWSRDCPRCMSEMDYVELSKKEKLWAPSEYAWECLKCPLKVRILDGFIDPSKGTALTERCRERNRTELFKAIGLVAFGQKNECQKYAEEEPEEAIESVDFFGSKNDSEFEGEILPKNVIPFDSGATASAGPA